MKVAITSQGPELSSQTDPRFGRAAWVIIVDSVTKEFEAVDNSSNSNAFKGAGIQAGNLIADKGADVLMTGHCGPNAFNTLNAGGVKVVNGITGTVEEALDKFIAEGAEYASDATVDSHNGQNR
ncbi:NifB/NifX family molybdenum-iron cluster-binding protein [Desulforhopalus vacuolatus]|uniref:NifB/NifX family molybdenum-iron cluster-binding protein n=1 Tax=Desulforhopalus vacuolatus TaxID=40414 RepID=UPI0019655C40|nr:NifB/NifX family molybdenum-iron cluster-binding protein [Desulforhopalus vacuolatus]MBM9519309.1 NifB/NifX family molybdenum-iron cluster-binding protein [Desulforhopalus vacuolatus]